MQIHDRGTLKQRQKFMSPDELVSPRPFVAERLGVYRHLNDQHLCLSLSAPLAVFVSLYISLLLHSCLFLLWVSLQHDEDPRTGLQPQRL